MLRKIGLSEFDTVYDIMVESFPVDEYRPYAEQLKLIKNPLYTIYTADMDSLNAFIAVWNFDEFVFVEHLAVAKIFRNAGLGGSILREVIRTTNKRICLEAEPPSDDISARRIKFYERNGFYLNKHPYIQPSISSGRKPIPLVILTTCGTLQEDEFCTFRDILYREVYGIY